MSNYIISKIEGTAIRALDALRIDAPSAMAARRAFCQRHKNNVGHFKKINPAHQHLFAVVAGIFLLPARPARRARNL